MSGIGAGRGGRGEGESHFGRLIARVALLCRRLCVTRAKCNFVFCADYVIKPLNDHYLVNLTACLRHFAAMFTAASRLEYLFARNINPRPNLIPAEK